MKLLRMLGRDVQMQMRARQLTRDFSFGSVAALRPAGWLRREASLCECALVSQLEALPGLSRSPQQHVGLCLHL